MNRTKYKASSRRPTGTGLRGRLAALLLVRDDCLQL